MLLKVVENVVLVSNSLYPAETPSYELRCYGQVSWPHLLLKSNKKTFNQIGYDNVNIGKGF